MVDLLVFCVDFKCSNGLPRCLDFFFFQKIRNTFALISYFRKEQNASVDLVAVPVRIALPCSVASGFEPGAKV